MSTPRIACVDVPALPLQLLLRREPEWTDLPVVVVRDDRPQGVILWANAAARHLRILPGMTFAAARSLAADLRAAVVEPHEIEAAVDALHQQLCNFSPRVEPSEHEPGVFFIDPSGLVPLYGSLEQWADMLRTSLQQAGYLASVVVGFHRYRCYALARTRPLARGPAVRSGPSRDRGWAWVVPDAYTENRLAANVALSALAIDPNLRDQLHVLGVDTLGQFARLPAAELASRFGAQAASLHALVCDRFTPLAPRKLVDPITTQIQLEPPDADHTRLLFGLKGALHRLMGELAARGQALRVLHLRLELDHAAPHAEYVEPARPTLDVVMLIDLVRLRLESLTLPAAVEAVSIELEGLAASQEQLALFRIQRRRDLDAAGRALARLQASLGPEAVTRARLRPAHLPEAGFAWESIKQIDFPRQARPPRDDDPPALCRRLLPKPQPLPARPRHEPEAWLPGRSPIARMHGPYRVSGGWWVRTVERDYYFAETKSGEVLWVFYDRPRRRWFLHGTID